jgi:rhamnulose-1-phosphate aldolase
MKSIKLNDAVNEQIAMASETAGYLWSRGWAERNAGNISLNLTEIIGGVPPMDDFVYVEMANVPKEAANKVFFVTGTSQRLRELTHPHKVGCILRFDETAGGYHVIWGGDNRPDFRPTSEFIPHLLIHLDRLAGDSSHRAIVHTHPIELICLTHYPKLHDKEDELNFALWSMLPEVRAFVPKGVAITPYTLPGSEKLARLTVEGLRHRDVVLWNKHGAIASAENSLEAFDFIDVANKGAIIYLKCLTSGFTPLGLTREELDELVQVLNL